MKPSLCLNMIVKNEADRIERCLASVLPHVKAAVILDTGSTDDTPAKIAAFCKLHHVPVHIGHGEFKNFSQARNDAFRLAMQRCNAHELPHCQFALLVDADMQLVVEDLKAFDGLDAYAASYDMMQKGGTISYANRRIVNLNWQKPPYVGVTHEYVDVPSHGMIAGAHFHDFADGANRVNKFERDAQLLEEALKSEPENGRYWYYLGNTYRDGNKFDDALVAYLKKFELGGWDEEQHSTLMNIADCHRQMGSAAGFVDYMLRAYSYRPQRAEPLYELARYYREKGDNAAALLFAKRGLSIPRPNDLLFVNDFAYSHGLRYEYSIAGYYDDQERAGAFETTNDLALDPTCDASIRWSARQNLYWHTRPLKDYCPSFTPHQLEFTPPEGYVAMNPSIVQNVGHVYCNIRCVNYRIDEHGRYIIRGTPNEAQPHAPIDTQNVVVKLDHDFIVRNARAVRWDRPAPAFDLVTGLEDMRLWINDAGVLSFNACVRELSPSGSPQQVIGQLSYNLDNEIEADNVMAISPNDACEKNWMHRDGLKFVYRLDTLATVRGPEHSDLTKFEGCPIHCGDIAGSSQCIPFNDGWLCVVHEAFYAPDGKRAYWHRFAWLNAEGRLRRISKPFVFLDRQIEFCAGLARDPNEPAFLLSFGVRDAEAWVARVNVEEVSAMLSREYEG